MQDNWFAERVDGPVRSALELVATGAVLTEARPEIALAVEGLFRIYVPEQWTGWPPEWTTDGMVVDLMWRTDPTTLSVAGRLWIDFTGRVIPVLGTFEIAAARVVARAHVGDADPVTDRVPTFGSQCLLLDGGPGGGPPVPHRTDHRRLVPVTWTEVAVIGP